MKKNETFFLLLGFCLGYTVWKAISKLPSQQISCLSSNSDVTIYNFKKPTAKQFILIAVMTTRTFLETRAVDIHETWGSRIPGSILYFVGDAKAYTGDLPVVTLNNINDTMYPPQLKSFTMIEFISETLADCFEWFVRSDDDLYIRTDKFEYMLRRVNSSQAWFIGQPGYGTQHEKGKLGLVKPFCMGGVGITFSRSTLVEVGKHLVPDCLSNTVTAHEDTELGRCVYKYTNLSCTTFKMWSTFLHNEKKYIAHAMKLSWLEEGAITLHPIKVHPHMQRIDSLYSDLKIRHLQQIMTRLHREISDLDEILKARNNFSTSNDDDDVVSNVGESFPTDVGSGKHVPAQETREFSASKAKIMLTVTAAESKNQSKSAAKLQDLLKLIDKEFEYEWDYLDKNRSLNTQRTEYHRTKIFLFTMSYLKSKIATELEIKYGSKFKSLPFAYSRLKSGQNLEILLQRKDTKNKKHLIKTIQKFSGIQFCDLLPIKDSETWIILPILGRPKQYGRFLETLVQVAERFGKLIKLKVVLNEDGGGQFHQSQRLSNHFRNSSKNLLIKTSLIKGTFSRGSAISKGVEELPLNSLLIFMDVDMYFDEYFLQRIERNTIRGKQVTFPICFSQFNPIIACYGKEQCSIENNYGNDFGLWREFGFGIASFYKEDLLKVGGFNLKIQGWGREDQDLYEKFIQRSDLQVLRTVDPSLIHMYHDKACNREELGDKYWDCIGSKLALYGSVESLGKIVLDLKLVKV